LIGATNIRHTLNDFLRREGGHIAYGIRPSRRKKGFGTILLGLALKKAKALGIDPVLLICDKDNPFSAAVIKKNGGILDSESEVRGNILQKYLIQM